MSPIATPPRQRGGRGTMWLVVALAVLGVVIIAVVAGRGIARRTAPGVVVALEVRRLPHRLFGPPPTYEEAAATCRANPPWADLQRAAAEFRGRCLLAVGKAVLDGTPSATLRLDPPTRVDYAGISFDPGVDLLRAPLLVDVPDIDMPQLQAALQRSPIVGVLGTIQGDHGGLPYVVAAMTWPILHGVP